MKNQNPIEIYQTEDGTTQVEVRFENDTVWLSQAQMVQLFGRDVSVISRHIRNAINEGEIDEKSNLQKMQIPLSDRPVVFYDLDTIISVGYRIKSAQGVAFRRWATARLKDYLTQGYAINRQRLSQNAHELEQALALIRKTAASSELTLESGRGLVDIVSRYTQTFLWLQQYDEGLLAEPKVQAGYVLPRGASVAIPVVERGEASDLGNLDPTVFGEPTYPSIEVKAAHLLYFVMKKNVFRRQQTQWRIPVRRFPALQRQTA